jgi:hypothetical protein
MKKSALFCLLFPVLLFAGCENSGKSIKDLAGLWVMDTGIAEYIDKAGFEIKNTDKGYSIFVGEISDNKLKQQADPAILTKKGEAFVAQMGRESTLQLIPDATGIKLLGFTGESKGTDFHFKKVAIAK